GDTHLGGDDIDRLMTELILAEIIDAGAASADDRPILLQVIRQAVIQAKWDLSEHESTEIRIPSAPGLSQEYRRSITRDEFESHIRPVVERTLGPVRQAMADAGLQPHQIDEAVLVGGSTRVPLVRRMVEEFFGRRPH